MNFIQNAIRNIQTTLLALAPLVMGGYLVYQGFKSKNLQQIGEGIAALSAGGIGVVAKDANKSGTTTVPR